jgi:hypothetical protein
MNSKKTLKGKRVLIVDDEEDILELLTLDAHCSCPFKRKPEKIF